MWYLIVSIPDLCTQTNFYNPPDPGDGINMAKFNFFRTWSCCILIQRESLMQLHGTEICCLQTPPPPPSPPTQGDRVNRSKSNFFKTWSICISNLLESQNVAIRYQSFVRRPPPPSDLRVKRSKFNYFRIWSCCI